jgi:hypothetical protein
MTVPAFDIRDAMSDAVSAALPVPESEAPAEDTPVASPEAEESSDEGEVSPEQDEPTGEDSDEVVAASDVELPEGFVAVPSVTEGLATDFVLRDEHGEVEVPALIVEYKANGKVRQDRLDQVVKLAQWGVYSQDREQRLKADTQQQVEQMEQLLVEREQQMERLLNDEAYREAVYEAYLNENSPERRAERAEQQMANLRLSQELQSISQTGEQFYAAEVGPAIQLIADALPTVPVEELEAKLEMAMRAHVEVAPNGLPYVPPSRYEAIRQYIVEDLALWAQAAHSRRSKPVTAAKQKANAELERAQVEAQKAKRMVGQKLKPVGQVGATPDRPKASAKPSTVDDAVSSALSAVLSSIR